jgi:predicted secreted protein
VWGCPSVSWTTAFAIYFVLWWVVLFAILPWGVRSQHEAGEIIPGSDPGAPSLPALGSKLVWTTVVSAVVFGLLYAAYVTRLAGLDDLATLWGLLR